METTAYGLLVHLIRDGVNIDQEKMVLWLNTMRLNDGGFITTTVRPHPVSQSPCYLSLASRYRS